MPPRQLVYQQVSLWQVGPVELLQLCDLFQQRVGELLALLGSRLRVQTQQAGIYAAMHAVLAKKSSAGIAPPPPNAPFCGVPSSRDTYRQER